MTLHRSRACPRARSMRGFSMLEVLVAVLVFSLGMIGLAGLLIYSIQSNHVAYLRTQATFLAHNMAARMGANPVGVWNGNYNIAAIDAAGTAIPSCAGGCNPQALATRDVAAWSQQLNTFLPTAAATINCTAAGISYTPDPAQVNERPPYGGTCQMTISWNEARSKDGALQLHTFAWVFEP